MICESPVFVKGQVYSCYTCLCCAINRRRIWQHRILLESTLHPISSFVTLTYKTEHLKRLVRSDGSSFATLYKPDAQLWLKRLRERVPFPIRYYGCGEYGENGTMRPHFHFVLFGVGCRTPHLYPTKQHRHLCRCTICALIFDTWGMGRISVDLLTPKSAAYVAGYVQKKLTNPKKKKVQEVLKGRNPEFPMMSLKPGIGAGASKMIASMMASIPELVEIDGMIPTTLRHGPRDLPLGRYIRQKVRADLGHSDKIPEETLALFKQIARFEFDEQAARYGRDVHKKLKEKRLAKIAKRKHLAQVVPQKGNL